MRLVSNHEIVPEVLNDGLAANRGNHGAGKSASLIILMTMAHSIKVITKEQKHLRLVQARETVGHDGEGLVELLGRYEIPFVSGIGMDCGRRILQKSLAQGKGRYGSRDWD